MIIDILTTIGINEIAGMATGGGSLLMAIIAVLIKLVRRSIKGARYKILKESLNKIETKIEENNEEGKENLKNKLLQASQTLNEIAGQL